MLAIALLIVILSFVCVFLTLLIYISKLQKSPEWVKSYIKHAPVKDAA